MKFLPSHVSSQEGLNGNDGGALLLVASPGCPHTHVLLDDHSRSGSFQKCNIADDRKKKNLNLREEAFAHGQLFEASAHQRPW